MGRTIHFLIKSVGSGAGHDALTSYLVIYTTPQDCEAVHRGVRLKSKANTMSSDNIQNISDRSVRYWQKSAMKLSGFIDVGNRWCRPVPF